MKLNTKHNAIRLSEVLGKESGSITSISIQKKNKNRFSVFVDEVFIVGVSDSCIVKLNLKKGDYFEQSRLDKIQQFEEKRAVKDFLIRILGRRDHSTLELKQKALKKGFNDTLINNALIDLESKGYTNNAEFAKKFARDKSDFNKWGKQKIRIELVKKGINISDITIALNEIDADDQYQKMQHLFEKSRLKFKRVPTDKRRKKIFDFFIRKGYDSDQVLTALPKWLTELDS